MELREIKKLLDKYYEGLTSLDEEEYLREYFRNHAVPDDLQADKELFFYSDSQIKDIPESEGLEMKLHQAIDGEIHKEAKKKSRQILFRIASIAAGIAILAASYFLVMNSRQSNRIKDTYSNPNLAYQEVKNTLLYISENLNRGTRPLQQVNKINQGVAEFSALSSLSAGFKDLQLVTKYYDSTKIESKTLKKIK